MEKRKGARSIKDIPVDVLSGLNAGELSSVNLTEWLAIDQRVLVKNVLISLDRENYINCVLDAVDGLEKKTVNTINQCIGYTLYHLSNEDSDSELFHLLKNHKSDLVRCWATYFIHYNESFTIADKLMAIRDFAADSHFGVREICWMAVREDIIEHLEESLSLLFEWTKDENEYIRRFTTESTRPRGVWCKHINELKEKPELGLPLLEALKGDSSKYVKDSVANWLNDASKSQPTFVEETCMRWWNSSDKSKSMYAFVMKALRSLKEVNIKI
ncbi:MULTISPECIES: DNA alkylation repair protein [Myroides]|uniref:DNA alkylation repair protein n=1 Tax=Myroides albus TaxID=2562892 RepID=A0A6I3LLU8_9FLAO|nr:MULTISPECIES: DNA alkylation repair protein [Myroides]MTG98834.1 DNA alkylation repair protein [Myroides albus]MVX36666.1 DNA alkylation repair protein [Myroides sp. LoEW2-1]UVD80469.1 DNA alkylation repair protein [Myroides albus]